MGSPRRTANNPEAPDLGIPESIDLFISRNRPDWKGSTARTYRKSLDTFERYASDEGLASISDLEMWQVGKYTDWLLQEDYARVTVQSKQKQARRWLKWLEAQGYIPIGTHLAIEPLQLDDSEQTSSETFEPDELREFLEFYRDTIAWYGKRRHALLEVIGHTGARRSCIRALDIGDYDPEERTLTFINRPETGTRLKRGDAHQRKVILSEKPNDVLHEFVERERHDVHDEHGRQPLFASRRGRPAKSTLTNWVYQLSLPCVMRECPHGRQRRNCVWTEQAKSSRCPSSTSPHPVRRGSITWQLNIGRSIGDVADRAATTPDVIRRYYDRPDLDAELRRRITSFDGIDICEHHDPTDIDVEVNP
jgi:site-specific recombinase XerD